MNNAVLDPVLMMENVIFLKRSSLFDEVRTSELKAVAAISKERLFKKDEYIIKEGEQGDTFFVVKSGFVKVVKNVNDSEVELAILSKEACFGEMVIFEDTLRSASCYALEDSVLLVIQRDELVEVIKQYPNVALKMFSVFGKRLRKSNDKIRELTEQLEKKGN